MANSALDYLDNLLGKKKENETEKPPASAGGSSALEYLDGLIGSKNEQTVSSATPAAPVMPLNIGFGEFYEKEVVPRVTALERIATDRKAAEATKYAAAGNTIYHINDREGLVNEVVGRANERNSYTQRDANTDSGSETQTREAALRQLNTQRQFAQFLQNYKNEFDNYQQMLDYDEEAAEQRISTLQEIRKKYREFLENEGGEYFGDPSSAEKHQDFINRYMFDNPDKTSADAEKAWYDRLSQVADNFVINSGYGSIYDVDSETNKEKDTLKLARKYKKLHQFQTEAVGSEDFDEYRDKGKKYKYAEGTRMSQNTSGPVEKHQDGNEIEYVYGVFRDKVSKAGYHSAQNYYYSGTKSGKTPEEAVLAEWATSMGVDYHAPFSGFAGKLGNLAYIAPFMTQEQRDIYAYYYAKEREGLIPEGTAKEYLETIRDDVNRIIANVASGNISTDILSTLLYGGLSGMGNFFAGIGKLFVSGDEAEDVPVSLSEYTQSYYRDKLTKKGGIGGIAFDIANTTSRMLPSIGASYLANYILPGSGAWVGSTLMGASAAGDAYVEGLRRGMTSGQAREYSLLIGLSETCLQKLLGGIPGMGGALTGKVVEKGAEAIARFAAGVNNAFAKWALAVGSGGLQLVANGMGESLEEFLQDVIEPHLAAFASASAPEKIDWEQAIYSGLMGFASSVLLGGGGAVNAYRTAMTPSAAETIAQKLINNNAADFAVAVGLALDPESKAYKIAQAISNSGDTPKVGKVANLITAIADEAQKTDGQPELNAPTDKQVSTKLEINKTQKEKEAPTPSGEIATDLSPAQAQTEGVLPSAEINARNAQITPPAPAVDKRVEWNNMAVDYGEQGREAFDNAFDETLEGAELAAVADDFRRFYNEGRNSSNGALSDDFILAAEETRLPARRILGENEATELEAAAFAAGVQDARNALTAAAESGIINTETNEGGVEYGRKQGQSIRGGTVRNDVQSSRGQAGAVQGEQSKNRARRAGYDKGRKRQTRGRGYGLTQEARGNRVSAYELGVVTGTDTVDIKVVSSPDSKLARDAAKNGWHYVEIEGAPEIYDGDDVTRVEGISYKYDGDDYIAVRNDSKKYTKEKLYYHEKAHKEIASGRVDLKTIAKTIVETGKSDADVATLVDAYLTVYENTMPLDEIVEEILADTKANMDRFGVRGAKKAMDTLRRAFGRVYEQSRGAKSTGESETKFSLAANAKNEVNRALKDTEYRNLVRLTDDSPLIITSQNGARDLPMLMKPSHIRENVYTEEEAKELGLPIGKDHHYHGLGETLFLDVIDNLRDVKEGYRGTKNATNPSRRENYFLLVSQIKDAVGNTINVPVYINEKGTYNEVVIDTNKIATVFGRDNFNEWLRGQIDKGDLVRVKIKNTQSGDRPALIADGYAEDVSYNEYSTTSSAKSQEEISPSQKISSADNLNPTESDDIRYSRKDNAEYLRLAEDPEANRAELERMVADAAKAAGYEFRRNTRNKLSPKNNDVDYYMFVEDETTLLDGYGQYRYVANADNAVDVESIKDRIRAAWESFKEYSTDNYPTEISDAEINPTDIVNSAGVWDNPDFVTFLWDRGVLTTEDTPAIKTNDGLLVFDYQDNPNRIKSADPVTYDDDGNVIPLSERFNDESENIRYSDSANGDAAQMLSDLRRQLREANAKLAAARGQLKRTEQPTVRSDDARRISRDVIKRYGSSASVDGISKAVEDLGNLIVRGSDEQGDATFTRVKEAATDIMYNIIAMSDDVYDADTVEVQKQIRSRLQSAKFYVSQYEKGDLSLDYESYDDFRRRNFGNVKTTSDPKAMHIDTFYDEICGQFPWMLDTGLTSQAEQLKELIRVSEMPLKPTYNIAEEAEVESLDLLDRIMSAELRQVETFADRAQKKLDQAVVHERLKQSALKEKITALKEDIEREKAKRREELKVKRAVIEEERKRFREYKQTQAEKRRAREASDRLLKMVKRVNKMDLNTPNRAWFEQHFGDIYTLAKTLTGNKIISMENLEKRYAHLKETDQDFIGSDRIENQFAEFRNKQRDIASMTEGEIAAYTTTLLMFEKQVRDGNRMTRIADRTNVRMMAYNVISDVNATKGVKPYGVVAKVENALITSTLDAVRSIRRYTGYNDGNPLYQRTLDLARGQEETNLYVTRARAKFANLLADKKFTRWFTGPHAEEIKVTVRDALTGEETELKLTPALRTALYLNNQNDDNRRHITYGGVLIPNIKQLKKGDFANAYAQGKTVRLTPTEISKITRDMTSEEKNFARVTNSYFSEMSAPEIERVYEELFGVPPKMVGAGYYPLKVVKGWMRNGADETFDISADTTAGAFDIGSPGWLKERVTSEAPIYLFPVDRTVNTSIEQHGKYVGLAIPYNNFNKLWNAALYKKTDRFDPLTQQTERTYAPNIEVGTVRQNIEAKWGAKAGETIQQFLDQISGKEKTGATGFFGRLRSNYAGAVLELNPSTALKQAPSGLAAAAVVGWQPLMKALNPALKADTSFIDKMTAAYLIRKAGYSSQELGELADRGKKLPAALSWIIGADLATTSMLKRAAAFYVRDNTDLAVGSDEYKKAVVDIYQQIISETQPTYDVLYRSKVLRSKNPLVRAVNMFKTQPFKNFNILYDALGNLQAKRRSYYEANRWANDTEESKRYAEEAKKAYHDAKKKVVWAFTSQAASGLMISLIMAGWDILRGRDKKYRDDEGEMSFWSFLKGLGINFASTGAGMIPGGGVILEYVEKLVDTVTKDDIFGTTPYGFSVPEVDLLNDTGSHLLEFGVTLYKELTAEDGADWENIGRKFYSTFEQFSQFAGIPLANARKTVEVMARQIFKSQGYFGDYLALRIAGTPDTNKAAYYDLLYKAYGDDKTEYDKLYKQLVSDGYSESAIKGAMEDRMKKAQGVDHVDDLSHRYLNPTQQREYDSVTSKVKRSEVWSRSDGTTKAKLEDIAYDVIAGYKRNTWQTESITTDNNLTQTEYILYKLALDVVDKPNSNGKYGTYTDAEKEKAVKMAKKG